MRIFGTSDLHLTISTPDKDMSKFGPAWSNHTGKIREGWKDIRSDDIVILAGDSSWATTIEKADEDFKFIDSLPGRKIITVGNHDYWEQTVTKSNNWFFEHYRTMVPLRHDHVTFADEKVAVCSVKGYLSETHPDFDEEYRRNYEKECNRLDNTLCKVTQTIDKIICAIHYPPVYKNGLEKKNRMVEVMTKYKVTDCVYGHLHAEATEESFHGTHHGIKFHFVAGDSHAFKPLLIREVD